MQGASLRPLWEDSAAIEDRPAVSEAVTKPFELKSLRSGPFKYILRVSPEDVARHGRAHIPPIPEDRQLFDLRQDPEELSNLLDRDQSDEQLSRRAESIEKELRARVSDRRRPPVTTRGDGEMLEALHALGYLEGDAPAERR
jgi:hypothetical protein